LSSHTAGALFTVGGMSLLLLLIGIHNAWDTVTYIAVVHTGQPPPDDTGAPGAG